MAVFFFSMLSFTPTCNIMLVCYLMLFIYLFFILCMCFQCGKTNRLGVFSGLVGITFPTQTSPHLTLPYLTSPHLALPHFTSPCLALPHFTSPHLALPCLASLHLTLPCLTSRKDNLFLTTLTMVKTRDITLCISQGYLLTAVVL